MLAGLGGHRDRCVGPMRRRRRGRRERIVTGRWLLGLDLGGGSIRCLLIDADSGESISSNRPWEHAKPHDAPTGAELDLAAAWEAIGRGVREVLARAGAAGSEVAGAAASSMRHASVILDAHGQVLLATSNRDARAIHETLETAAAHGEALHRDTGHWPNPVQPLGRLLWLQRNAPERWSRAAHHLSLSDWAAYRLCGEIASDPTQAAETGLLALRERAWSASWIERMSLPPSLLPELREPGTRLGSLSREAAQHLGLSPGIPVAVGGGDTQCGLLGAGVLSPGGVGIVAGTTAPLQRVLEVPLADPEIRMWTGHHVVPGRWTLESNAGGVGDALAWIASMLYAGRPHPLLEMFAEADRSRPGAGGILSTLGAAVMNARELRLPIGHLTLSVLTSPDAAERRPHVARAVLEGALFSLRANLAQAESLPAPTTPALRIGGGLSRSAVLTRLLADATGRPVEVARVAETTALGAALCAGVAAGVFADLAEAAARLDTVARAPAPDAERAADYDAVYADWLDVLARGEELDRAATPHVLRGIGPPVQGPEEAAPISERPRILVTACMDPEGLAALREFGEVEYASFRDAMRMLTGPPLVEALRGVQIFVSEVDILDAAALARCDDLRLIAVCRGDAVNVDLEACTALGIPVIHTPGRNADAVADLAVAFMLMLGRRLPEANAFLREPGGEAGDMGRMGRAFGTLQGRELWCKTVGLVGLGAVGRGVVRRLQPFGARCLVFDPYLDDDAVRLAGAEPAALEDLLSRSDFVSLHAVVTESSRGMIGAAELERMPRGAFLINTARAALVDEDALCAALRSGQLGGAALDVFALEPPGSDHPLLAMPNVIATPHVGGNTAEVAAHQARIVAEEIERLRRGQPPHHVLNPETLDAFAWDRPRPRPSAELVAQLELGQGPGPAVSDLQRETGRPAAAGRPAAGGPAAGGPAAERPTQPSSTAPPSSPAPAPAESGAAAEVRERFERVLQRFVEAIAGDAQLQGSFPPGQDVLLHFVLTDSGHELYFGIGGGTVLAGLGAPEQPAPVLLKLKSTLLDGMFTGTANPMQAAMNGELSFSGDAAKAMTLSGLQQDLSRIYRAAREAAGDPGDLGLLSAPVSAPAEARAQEAGEDDVRHELLRVVDELYGAQLITATGGNVSARADRPGQAWITPSQLFKGDLAIEVLVRMDENGRAVDPEARAPSSEALMHAAIYRARSDVAAVIHCHAPHATILANAGLPFLPISTEAAFFSRIGRVPFIMPGTSELAEAVVEAMGDGWAVLMQNHGLLVAGRTLRRAADMCEIIERTCEVILGCRAVGVDPPVLPRETVDKLAKIGDLMA